MQILIMVLSVLGLQGLIIAFFAGATRKEDDDDTN